MTFSIDAMSRIDDLINSSEDIGWINEDFAPKIKFFAELRTILEECEEKKPATDPTINDDSWRTFKRVLPKDVHEEMKYFEALAAEHSGIPPRFQGVGNCVSVWSILMHTLRQFEPEVIRYAEDWKADSKSSGEAARSTS